MIKHLHKMPKVQLLIGALVFFLVSSLFALTAVTEYSRAIATEKRMANDHLILMKSQVEKILSSRLQSVQGLIAYVQMNPNLSENEFTQYVTLLMPNGDPLIKNIAILKDTTVIYTYPKASNTSVIGRNLAQVPEQKNDVLYVKNNTLMKLTAPVKLIQGGRGVICRIPILIHQADALPLYWGQISLVFDYDQIIADIFSQFLDRGYLINLLEFDSHTRAKKIVWIYSKNQELGNLIGSTLTPHIEKNLKLHESISRSISLYQVEWILQIYPEKGWNGLTSLFFLYVFLGLFFATVSSAYVLTLQNAKLELQSLVNERTTQLINTNTFLEQSVAEIEEKQAELTELNNHLEVSLDELKSTQSQLIASEKYAALGELVAGVAHEINTPLGISVTLASYLDEQHKKLINLSNAHTLSKRQLDEYNHNVQDALIMLNTNLDRAAGLVHSFKQVAVDQSTLELRQFNLYAYLNDILHSLTPKFKHRKIHVSIECDQELTLTSYPGALSQIITNLITNSTIHGFSDDMNGHITIKCVRLNSGIELVYTDNGLGIASQNLARIFDPFFTTRKNQGSTGLGMHIVYNLVTQTLKGTIDIASQENHGVAIKMTFPDLQ